MPQSTVLDKIKSEILIPVLSFLFLLAFIYFLWGVVRYIMNLNNPSGRQDGQRHMFWGAVGLAIMLGAFGIVNFVFNTVTDNGRSQGIGGKTIEKPDVIKNNAF
jgi:hypothetical protein